MSEELMITKEDLVNWLNRSPSNDDLDLIGFITTRLENFYKLEQENKQLKEELERSMKANVVLDNTNTDYASIIFELEEWLKEEQERYRDYLSTRPKNDSEYNSKYATQCGLSQVDVILDKIQELKEKYK